MATSIQVTSGVMDASGGTFSWNVLLNLSVPELSMSFTGAGGFPLAGVSVAPAACREVWGCSPGDQVGLSAGFDSAGVDYLGHLTVDGVTYLTNNMHPFYPHLTVLFNSPYPYWTVPDLGSATTTSITKPVLLSGGFTPGVGNPLAPRPGEPTGLYGYGYVTIYLDRGTGEYQDRWRTTRATYTLTPYNTVPEPASFLLFGIGAATFGLRRRTRKRASSH